MKNKRNLKRRIMAWSILGALIIAVGIRILATPRKTNYAEVKASTGNLATYYSFPGSIEAKNRQTVFADRAMQIKDIKVEQGEKVSADTVLMTTSMGEKIKSKIAGEVANIYADENAQLMPGAKLMDIIDYSDLQLKVQVDEYDLTAVSKDKEAVVTIHALNKDVSAKITDVSREGEYLNGVTTFTAIISLPSDNDLRVGMSAEARVLNKSVSNAVLLPMSVIQFDAGNNPYVLVKGGDDAPQNASVTLGINDGVQTEVKTGVASNDIVLVPPAVKSAGFGPRQRFGQGAGNPPHENFGGGNGQ